MLFPLRNNSVNPIPLAAST